MHTDELLEHMKIAGQHLDQGSDLQQHITQVLARPAGNAFNSLTLKPGTVIRGTGNNQFPLKPCTTPRAFRAHWGAVGCICIHLKDVIFIVAPLQEVLAWGTASDRLAMRFTRFSMDNGKVLHAELIDPFHAAGKANVVGEVLRQGFIAMAPRVVEPEELRPEYESLQNAERAFALLTHDFNNWRTSIKTAALREKALVATIERHEETLRSLPHKAKKLAGRLERAEAALMRGTSAPARLAELADDSRRTREALDRVADIERVNGAAIAAAREELVELQGRYLEMPESVSRALEPIDGEPAKRGKGRPRKDAA